MMQWYSEHWIHTLVSLVRSFSSFVWICATITAAERLNSLTSTEAKSPAAKGRILIVNSPSQPWWSDWCAEVWERRSINGRGEIITTHNHGSSLATALIDDRWPRVRVSPDYFYYTWTYNCMMSECSRTFGRFCRTFIPNTSPDGSITRGSNSSPRRWMKTENPFGDLMTKWLGRWNGILTSRVMLSAVGAALLTLWACCSILCFHEWLGRAEGKTGRHECRRIWMETSDSSSIFFPMMHDHVTWVLNGAVEGWYSNVGSLVARI